MKTRISSAEWKIMEMLWEGPRTLTEMVKTLSEREQWHKSTIITMVRRLENKQMVRYEQNSRTKIFFPAISRDEAVGEQTESFLQRAYNGSLGCLVNGMVERNSLTQEDIDELYEILHKAEEALK